MKKIITLIIITLLASSAFAATRNGVSSTYPVGMRSVAALGMGDAFYVKSDNKYAPFYNPAGLARVKRNRVDIVPFMMSANMDTIDFVQDVIGLDFDNNTDVANMLQDYVGKPISGRVQLYPSYTRPFFTVGGYIDVSADAIASNPVLPELNRDAYTEVGVVLGGAHSVFYDRLQLGVAGRFFYRINEKDSFTFIELSKDDFDVSWDTMNKGYNLMADLGAIYNIYHHGVNPRIGVAVNNISIVETEDTDVPPVTLTLSAGISPKFERLGINTDLIIDIKDITFSYEQDDDLPKRINIGAEARFLRDIIALRAGIHQGYFTAGFGIDLTYLQVDYAYYKEEIGAYSGQKS
ncbi:MAG: hypothetical protein LBV04_08200, partial [Deferribacteraceae bacterium]|nr:hypothetical protein [Deferribacteraceae bacterium]